LIAYPCVNDGLIHHCNLDLFLLIHNGNKNRKSHQVFIAPPPPEFPDPPELAVVLVNTPEIPPIVSVVFVVVDAVAADVC
jgi:hypothetical protein